jgi:hypothetical protein
MDFITIAEAAKLTGRHEKTIRRWVKKQLEKDPHAKDRIVRDTIASGFTYRVDKDYLLTDSPPLDTPEQSSQHTAGQGTVLPPEQGRQANPASTGTNHKRKEATLPRKGEKLANRQSEKRSTKPDQPNKKGFFSFFRGK